MTDSEKLAQLDANFEKLKHNREKLPLDQLTTRYAKSYNALVGAITEGADWFADRYLEVLAFPRHPKDAAGNEWLDRKLAAIIKQENRPGGLRDRWRAALIDQLNRDEFEQLVYERYARCLDEAFDPYWQRHCRWVGESGKRWIYNDIFKKFWLPPCEQYPGGGWINSDYSGWDGRFPPHLKEETA